MFKTSAIVKIIIPNMWTILLARSTPNTNAVMVHHIYHIWLSYIWLFLYLFFLDLSGVRNDHLDGRRIMDENACHYVSQFLNH